MPSPETPPQPFDLGDTDILDGPTSMGEIRSSRWFRIRQRVYRFLGLAWRTAPARNGGRYFDLP